MLAGELQSGAAARLLLSIFRKKQTIMISPAQKLRYFITFFPAMKLIEW